MKKADWRRSNQAPRGKQPGDGRELTPEQEAAIQRLICDKRPGQPKMTFAL
ncbi:MAG: hypothetical protein IPL70_03945 [Uliginosibacterium sp.]|nr:hypothetical protein [Uliginosibacterium sp.]